VGRGGWIFQGVAFGCNLQVPKKILNRKLKETSKEKSDARAK